MNFQHQLYYYLMLFVVLIIFVIIFYYLQGENVIKEIFPKKVAELNALLEVLFYFVSNLYVYSCSNLV